MALRMVLGLVVVAAVAFAVIRALARRWGVGPPEAGRGRLRVLDRVTLSPGRTLHLVEAPGALLVIATGSEGTTAVAQLPRPPAADGPSSEDPGAA
jgi:flagellar biogenesis protein FliO